MKNIMLIIFLCIPLLSFSSDETSPTEQGYFVKYTTFNGGFRLETMTLEEVNQFIKDNPNNKEIYNGLTSKILIRDIATLAEEKSMLLEHKELLKKGSSSEIEQSIEDGSSQQSEGNFISQEELVDCSAIDRATKDLETDLI
jgi:hypothetical protein